MVSSLASSVGMEEFYSGHMRAQQALLNTVLPLSSGLLLSLLLFVRKSQTFRVTELVGYISGSTGILKLDDQTCNSSALYSSICVFQYHHRVLL